MKFKGILNPFFFAVMGFSLTTFAHATESINPCSPLGAQRIAVILADYSGSPANTGGSDLAYLRELFLGEHHDFSVSDYFKTVSSGLSFFQSVKILGPYHLAKPFIADASTVGGIYNAMDAWEESLIQLARPDQDFSQIDRVVFVTPNAVDVHGVSVPMAAGMAGQGVCNIESVNAEGVHRKLAHAWILARPEYKGINLSQITGNVSLPPAALEAAIRKQMMSDMAPLIHELGHTFGFGHANQVNRPQPGNRNAFMNDEILPGANDTLYQNSYADPFSAMGSNQIQWLNVAHLTQTAWLQKNQIEEVKKDGVYRIYPLELASNQLKGIKIPRLVGHESSTSAYLWAEYRKRSSVYDTEFSGIHHSTDGAIVHYTNPQQPGPNSIWPYETVLLNFHPSGQAVNPYEPDLTLTTKWKDDHSRVSLEVVAVTADYLDLKVSFAP